MRIVTWRLSLVLGLGIVLPASVLAGPRSHAQPVVAPDEVHRARDGGNADAIAQALAPLAPAISGLVGPVATPEFLLASDEAHFARAAAHGEPDATVFFDEGAGAICALDEDLTENRLRILAHETARAELRSALGASPAPWFAEGFACYVETADATDEGVVLGRVDLDRKVRARSEIRSGKERALERLLRLDAPAFERGERVHRDVALAWGLVHFLVHGGERPRRAFDRYVRTLETTHDPLAAEAALRHVISRAELARSLEEYLRRL
jgi:hypothetical protein